MTTEQWRGYIAALADVCAIIVKTKTSSEVLSGILELIKEKSEGKAKNDN